MPFSGSASQDAEEELIYLIQKLTTLKGQASRAKSGAELTAKVAEMRVAVNRGMRTGYHWAGQDLKKVFDDEYRAHWSGTKPKTDVDAAYNLRKKSKKSMNRLESGLNQWVDRQGRSVVAGKQLALIEKAMPSAKGEEFVKLRNQASALRKTLAGDEDIPSIKYFSKRGKHAAVAQMPAPTYIRMALRAGHVDNENQGFIRGARAAGIEFLLARDGDECGWVTHDSRPLADGMDVTPAEALQHPKAHPNCQRYFVIPSKQTRKEAASQAKVRERAAKKAQAVARKAALAKVARAAKTTAKAAAVGYKIYRSPATQILINNIVQERYALPEPLKEFVAKFARYGTQEKAVASAASLAEKQEVSSDEVRQRILEWSDSIIGAEDATHPVPVAMQRVLGLQPEASTTRITEATWSYGDYIAKHNGQVRSSMDNLVDSHVWAAARSELHDESPVLASFFHLSNPRGFNVGGATGQTVRVIRSAFRKDADQITEEAIKELATLIDPFYWVKGKYGPVKMSLGVSTEGRRDLAAKLFRQIRDARRWTEVDRQAASALGVELVEPVNLEDVRKALLPRVTLNPGGLFSFTVASENGLVRPIFRILPQWGVAKTLAADLTLSSGAIPRLKQLVDEGEDLGGLLRALPDEIITHLNLYRNGPLNAHLSFWGSRFNGYSVSYEPDGGWIRLANRYRRYERFGPGKGQIIPLQRIWTDISVMPTHWSTITFTGKNRQFDVIANLHRWSGSLAHVSREMRIDYLSLKYWYAKAQEEMQYHFEQLHGSELTQVRSYDDLRQWADGFKDNARALGDVPLPGRPVGQHNISPLLQHRASVALRKDLERFNNAWDTLFPHLRRPDLSVYTPGSLMFEDKTAPLFYRGGEAIYIRDNLANAWTDVAQVRNRNTFIGFWPQGTEDPVASIWHEAGHYLWHPLGSRSMEQLIQDLSLEESFPQYVRARMKLPEEDRLKADLVQKLQQIFLDTPEMRRWVTRNLSGYATRNIHELISEAFTEYTMAKHPRPLAMVIGRWLAVYGGQ